MRGATPVLFIALCCCAAASQAAAKEKGREALFGDEWARSVEEHIAGIQLGPLKNGVSPDDFAHRTRFGAISAQANRLRAKLFVAMAESADTIVHVCPCEQSSNEAIQAIISEFQSHSFAVHWIAAPGKCQSHNGFIFANIPPAKASDKNKT